MHDSNLPSVTLKYTSKNKSIGSNSPKKFDSLNLIIKRKKYEKKKNKKIIK